MLKLYNKFKPYLFLALVVLVSSLALWSPFILRQENWFGFKIQSSDFLQVYKQFDGPLYIIPAKSLYAKDKIDLPVKGFILSLPLSFGYFAAHLPGYPLVIRLFAPFMGYLKAMIFSNLLFTTFLAWLFYFVVSRWKTTANPLFLTTVLLFLPRFLVIRSTGAPESLFLFLILGSLFLFEKKNYLLAGLLGGLSAVVKTPGVLLFVAYLLTIGEEYFRNKQINWKALSTILLIPAGLLGVFLFYQYRYNDFFAFFHTNATVPMPYPFSAFNYQSKWVATGWLDDIAFFFVLYGLTAVYLWKEKLRSLFYFTLVFFVSILFVQHRDIARYSLPLWPMALIAFSSFFTSKQFRIVFFLILIPAAFFYGWNMLLYNQMPISDWSPFF